jgi:hypothetical protein
MTEPSTAGGPATSNQGDPRVRSNRKKLTWLLEKHGGAAWLKDQTGFSTEQAFDEIESPEFLKAQAEAPAENPVWLDELWGREGHEGPEVGPWDKTPAGARELPQAAARLQGTTPAPIADAGSLIAPFAELLPQLASLPGIQQLVGQPTPRQHVGTSRRRLKLPNPDLEEELGNPEVAPRIRLAEAVLENSSNLAVPGQLQENLIRFRERVPDDDPLAAAIRQDLVRRFGKEAAGDLWSRAALPPQDEDDLGFAPTLEELKADPERLKPPEPLIPYLAWPSRLTVLSGLAKAGKSTLLAHAAAALTKGGEFLGGSVQEGRALLVGLEENLDDMARRADELGTAPDRLRIVFCRRPDLLEGITNLLSEWPADLIVLDSLQAYAHAVTGGEAPQSGDSAAWSAVIRPLEQLARESRSALVVLHHARRSDESFRDSGEIAAAADLLLEMRMPTNKQPRDTRHLAGRGRLGIVDPFVIALQNGQYVLPELVGKMSDEERALSIIRATPGITRTGANGAYKQLGRQTKEGQKIIDRLIHDGLVDEPDKGKGLYPVEPGEEFVDSTPPEDPDAISLQDVTGDSEELCEDL